MSNKLEDMIKTGKIPSTEEFMALLLNDRKPNTIITDDEVKFHDDPSRKDIVLPVGFGFAQAKKVLELKEQEQEAFTQFDREYDYRVDDGIYATSQVLKERYGLTLARGGFMSPPETREVTIGRGKKVTCAVGEVGIPALGDSSVLISSTTSRKYGPVFKLYFGGPRKHKAEAMALFDAVERHLKTNSIYRGHVLAGANELEFIDPMVVDRRQVVFAQPVRDALENLVFSPIRNTALFRKENIGLKRAILFHGPFGTGKTSIGMIIAQEAEANGWTFITARPGDKIQDVMRTAALYEPACVLVEDIETEGASVKELLDVFDGATAKGRDIIMAMTTNNIKNVEQGLMRPGRIDGTVYVGELDPVGVRELIQAVVNPIKLSDHVDYDVVYESMTDFLPAFVKASIERAQTWALTAQGADYVLDTAALAGAANSLHDQLRLMGEAKGRVQPPAIESAMKELVRSQVIEVVDHTLVADDDGDFMGGRLGFKADADVAPRVQGGSVR